MSDYSDYYSAYSSEDYSNFSSGALDFETPDIKGMTIRNYVLLDIIGSGGFASVWLVYNNQKRQFYALKMQNPDDLEEGEKEVEVLKKAKDSNCQHVIELIESFNWKYDGDEYICMVLELLSCSLYTVINDYYPEGIPSKSIIPLLKQMAHAMKEVQGLGYLHTDIKPENFMLKGPNNKYQGLMDFFKNRYDKLGKKKRNKVNVLKILDQYNETYSEVVPDLNESLKIIDFGNCRDIDNIDCQIQTRYYRAPEVIMECPIDDKCDVWSLGCVLYELITGEILFDPSKTRRFNRDRCHLKNIIELCGSIPTYMMSQSKRYSYFFQKSGLMKGCQSFDKKNLSCEQKKLLSQMICVEPTTRVSLSELLDLLT